MPRPLYPSKSPGTRCVGGWVGTNVGLDGCWKTRFHPTGIRSPARPARSESLYRLSYPVPIKQYVYLFIYLFRIRAASFLRRFKKVKIEKDVTAALNGPTSLVSAYIHNNWKMDRVLKADSPDYGTLLIQAGFLLANLHSSGTLKCSSNA